MLYHEDFKKVKQSYVMQITKKIDDSKYEVISKNYFTTKNDFEILAKNIPTIKKIRINKAMLVKENIEVSVVNTPMTKLIVEFNKKINLLPGDILRTI
jgi:hypothetical protein